MSDSIMNFRVESELKKAFETAAKSQDLTSSQMLRQFMRDTVANYMASNAQKGLFNETKTAVNTKASTKQKKPVKSVIPDSWRKK